MGEDFEAAFARCSEELKLKGIKLESDDGVSFSFRVSGALDKIDDIQDAIPVLRTLKEMRDAPPAEAPSESEPEHTAG